MKSNQNNLLRKYGKTIFKLLEKRWIREVPLAEEERERDRFKEEEIKRKIVRAAIGRARTITEEQREKREIEGRREEEPTSQTIIRRIKRTKDVEEIIRATNERLKEQLKKLKKKLRKKTIYLAIDAHDEPYYGKKQQWTVGGRRKQSTNKQVHENNNDVYGTSRKTDIGSIKHPERNRSRNSGEDDEGYTFILQ